VRDGVEAQEVAGGPQGGLREGLWEEVGEVRGGARGLHCGWWGRQ